MPFGQKGEWIGLERPWSKAMGRVPAASSYLIRSTTIDNSNAVKESESPWQGGLLTAADTQSGNTLAITVILCTYNRCRDLAGTLESIAVSKLAASLTWEVLVVDNNSTDQTREVVESFCRRCPGRFRYLFEAKAGKSNALNAGIVNARGEVLAFTDDDVTVEPTWLHKLTAALRDDQWAGSGGRTLPAQKFKPPAWLPNDFSSWGSIAFAYFDLGDSACELLRPPYGANMAFRKSVFERYGGFRTDMGPSPKRDIPRPNEDTEFGRRVLAAGERLRYEPSAVVYHPISQGRITQEYFLSWWFDYGRAMIRELGERPAVYGIPRDYLTLLRCSVEITVMTLRSMLDIVPHKRFSHKCWAWFAAGRMVEIFRRNRSQKKENSYLPGGVPQLPNSEPARAPNDPL
jgi:glycosyltransferase involved in cell wall biosynthesis